MIVKPWDERCSSVLLITWVHDCWLCGRESIESCQLVQGAGGWIELLWRTLKLSYIQAALSDTRLSGSQLRHIPSALLFPIRTEDLVNVHNPQIQGWEMGNGGGHRHRKWSFFASFSYSCFTSICNFTIMTCAIKVLSLALFCFTLLLLPVFWPIFYLLTVDHIGDAWIHHRIWNLVVRLETDTQAKVMRTVRDPGLVELSWVGSIMLKKVSWLRAEGIYPEIRALLGWREENRDWYCGTENRVIAHSIDKWHFVTLSKPFPCLPTEGLAIPLHHLSQIPHTADIPENACRPNSLVFVVQYFHFSSSLGNVPQVRFCYGKKEVPWDR